MGTCCSCHFGGRFKGLYAKEENAENEVQKDIVLNGELGARIRLQGSSNHVSMFTQQGKKGINQDAITFWEGFTGDRDMFFGGVFDGHGPSGHKVARYIRDVLPAKVSLLYKQSCTDGRNGFVNLVKAYEEGNENPFFLSWKAMLTKCFQEMDKELEGQSSIESYYSGTTSVCVLKKGEHLVLANLGDSRAVICKTNESNQLVAEQLTVDLKPNLPDELQRIKSCQGRVLAMEAEPNVYRVWMPHEDCPGLAMARAFGDFCIKDYGLISTPKVTYRKLTEKDEFVVLATDGVWDVLSNNDVINIVASAKKQSLAAKLVVEEAVRAWKYKYPYAKNDDCSVICLFFKCQTHMSQISFKYGEINRHVTSMRSCDDELDTVLNCNVDENSGKLAITCDYANKQRKRRQVTRL